MPWSSQLLHSLQSVERVCLKLQWIIQLSRESRKASYCLCVYLALPDMRQINLPLYISRMHFSSSFYFKSLKGEELVYSRVLSLHLLHIVAFYFSEINELYKYWRNFNGKMLKCLKSMFNAAWKDSSISKLIISKSGSECAVRQTWQLFPKKGCAWWLF